MALMAPGAALGASAAPVVCASSICSSVRLFATPAAPTLQTILAQLDKRNRSGSGARPAGARPPRIAPDSKHYLYALLILAGVSNNDAFQEVGVSRKTAEAWRRSLRNEGEIWFGRPVEYDFVARYVLEETWRQIVDSDRADSPKPA